MPNVLRPHQHELLWPNGVSALIFGTDDTCYVTLTPPQFESSEGTVGDVDRPREDSRAFGEDTVGAKQVAFEIGVLTDRHGFDDVGAANLDAINRFDSVWRSPRFRDSSAKVAILRTNAAGVTYRCYGRPRNMGEATGAFTAYGYTPITAEFHTIDGAWYSDVERVETVTIPPPINPGLIGPLKAPLSAMPITSHHGNLAVGGTRDTWPVITFHGPVLNPRLTIGGLRVELDASLREHESITIDPRPWVRTVTRNDGAPMAGALTQRTTMLRAMTLAPGSHLVKYDGIDLTGTSHARIAWRDARNRP